MTLDEAGEHGARIALDHLALCKAAHGEQIALMIAGGLAAGCRNFVAQVAGPRAAYELCQGLADDVTGQVYEQQRT